MALFTTNAVPFFDPSYQQVVETSTDRVYEIRTGLSQTGDATNETFIGSAERDQFYAGDGDDVLNGGLSSDSLFGEGGNDTLIGGAGGDILNGGIGNDTMIGGLGGDVYFVDSITDVVTEALNEGADTINSTFAIDLTLASLANIEHATLLGTTNINATGNLGENVLIGNTGNNVLTGNDGNDRLIGGGGNDSLIGGNGADILEWNLADKGTLGTPATDTVTGFNIGNDILDLRDLLQGERSTVDGLATSNANRVGNLLDFLDIAVVGPDTVIRVSSTGGFTGGTYNAAQEDQRIVIAGLNLFTTTGTANEIDLINNLLVNGRLLVD